MSYWSYDDDEWPPCPQCGCTEEGPDWAPQWLDGERIIAPYGRCKSCGWSCTACPDIEDLWERCQDMAERFPGSTEVHP